MSDNELKDLATDYAEMTAGPLAEKVYARPVIDAGHLATRLLQLLPLADDGERITGHWLVSVGFEFAEGGQYIAEKEVGYDSHVIGVSTTNLIGWNVYDSFDDGDTVSIGEVATRGAVRRLCAALNIPLTESTP